MVVGSISAERRALQRCKPDDFVKWAITKKRPGSRDALDGARSEDGLRAPGMNM
jgi:hypothetical protein